MAPIYITGEISEAKAKAIQELGVPLTKYEKNVNIITSKERNQYVELPENKLIVKKEIILPNYRHGQMQKELHPKNKKELTTYEFLEFLKEAKENHPEFYRQITKPNKWQGIWLSNSYKKEGEDMFTKFYVFDSEGEIREKIEPLEEGTLMENKTPGINLDNLLENHTKHGLPKESTLGGDLHYWAPVNGAVTGFGAGPGWAIFNADRNPLVRYSNVGVLAAEQLK